MKTPRLCSLRHLAACLVCLLLPSIVVADEAIAPSGPVALFNGRDLTGWVIVGRDGDPAAKDTWTVQDGLLRASGSPYGYARTAQAYRDYRLRIEWRWVPMDPPVDAQGKPRGRNSGVLLHTQGEDKVWPSCLEAQLFEGNAGDFIAMATPIVFDELVAMRAKAVTEAGSDEAARQRALSARRIPRQEASSERPIGEWNTYDIVCRGNVVTLTVNDVLQNTATGLSISGGTIGLQSEGMPVEFRTVEISPVGP